MGAADQLLFKRIQRLNKSILADVDVCVVASHAVGVVQALSLGGIARQGGGVSTRHQQYQEG
jgi:hypothetical protein